MLMTALYAAGASLPLLFGALVGARWSPPRHLVATALAYAAGALIASVSFELFEPSYQDGGPVRAGLAFGAGSVVFVVADYALDRTSAGNPAGWALLAAVTLDGIPENAALGVSLTGWKHRAAGRRVRQQLPRSPRRRGQHARERT